MKIVSTKGATKGGAKGAKASLSKILVAPLVSTILVLRILAL